VNRRLLIIWALCLTALAAHAVETVVLYGDDDYPPYSYVDQGQFKGVYVDLLRAAVQRMADAYRLELQPIPWKRGLAQVESGGALGLFPPYLRKERKFIQPYSEPLYREQVVMVCNDAAMRKPRSKFPDDYGDVLVGINIGFALSDAFVRARDSGAVKVDESKGNDRNLLKLADNRIGCYANDRLAIRYALSALTRRADTRALVESLHLVETTELSGQDAYIGYSANANPPYKAAFIARLNMELQALKHEGMVERLVSQYGQ
jgi:polar amino acid transport system substrate-binding protein